MFGNSLNFSNEKARRAISITLKAVCPYILEHGYRFLSIEDGSCFSLAQWILLISSSMIYVDISFSVVSRRISAKKEYRC